MPPDVSPTPEEARATRRAKLFARWSNAGRLGEAETAEIADLIAASNGTPPAALLEGELAPKPGTYAHTYEWYADSANLAIWEPGTGVASRIRTIKRWVHDGRNHQPRADYPPLDNPAQLGAWLLRVKKRRLKAWDPIFAMAAPPPVDGEVTLPKNPTNPQSSKSGQSTPPAVSVDLQTVVAFTALESLDAQRRVVGAAYQLYAKALLENTPDLDQRHRAYIAASSELRKTEKDTEELREARGELIPRDRLVVELRRVHTAMAGNLRQILSDRAVPPATSAEIITEFFRPLRRGDFGLPATDPAPSPVGPPPAAAP